MTSEDDLLDDPWRLDLRSPERGGDDVTDN